MQTKNLIKGNLVEIYISYFSGTKFGIIIDDIEINNDVNRSIPILCYNRVIYVPYYFISNLKIHS